jgi:hypothetical protein
MDSESLVRRLLLQIAMHGNSPARLRAVRQLIARRLSGEPEGAVKQWLAVIDKRLDALGEDEPCVRISIRAQEVAEELGLSNHTTPHLLRFLSEAEEILRDQEECSSAEIFETLLQAGQEYHLLVAKLSNDPRLQ